MVLSSEVGEGGGGGFLSKHSNCSAVQRTIEKANVSVKSTLTVVYQLSTIEYTMAPFTCIQIPL